MSLFCSKWGRYFAVSLAAFSSGITIYLLISDSARRSEIRRRKNFVTTLDDEISSAITPLEKARHKFGALRIGGRFVNPFEAFECP